MSATVPSTSTPTANPVTAAGSIGADMSQAAIGGAQIAASVATSNPVGIAVGSITALNALVGLVQNVMTLQKAGSLTPAQVDQIFTTLGMQTVSVDEAWMHATGSAAV